MKHQVTPELRAICSEIVAQGWSETEWAEHEADDWFQSATYDGGFDATEMAFCFSLIAPSRDEVWLQFSLSDAERIANGMLGEVSCTPAE